MEDSEVVFEELRDTVELWNREACCRMDPMRKWS